MQDKRLHQHHLYIWQRVHGVRHQRTVDPVEPFIIHAVVAGKLMPCIVDADKDADDIRFFVPAVCLDPRVNIYDSVAADATVFKCKSAGIPDAELSAHHQCITLPNGNQTAVAYVSADIGDRVTQKKNFHYFSPYRMFLYMGP